MRRTDRISEERTGGINVVATEPTLLETVGGTAADGTFLNDATATQPAVVLGSEAAKRLGIDDLRRRRCPGRPEVDDHLVGRRHERVDLLDREVLERTHVRTDDPAHGWQAYPSPTR